MSAFDWFLIAWWLSSALLTIGNIGKRRDVIEPSTAVEVVLIYTLFTALLLASRGVIA